mmetsp:Transcript_4783/g.15465  ORF Transcript_4783/g.15465 Transcript_4783/m.15465 type:complete len:330 (+) Transcript_4783:113-1102(+)
MAAMMPEVEPPAAAAAAAACTDASLPSASPRPLVRRRGEPTRPASASEGAPASAPWRFVAAAGSTLSASLRVPRLTRPVDLARCMPCDEEEPAGEAGASVAAVPEPDDPAAVMGEYPGADCDAASCALRPTISSSARRSLRSAASARASAAAKALRTRTSSSVTDPPSAGAPSTSPLRSFILRRRRCSSGVDPVGGATRCAPSFAMRAATLPPLAGPASPRGDLSTDRKSTCSPRGVLTPTTTPSDSRSSEIVEVFAPRARRDGARRPFFGVGRSLRMSVMRSPKDSDRDRRPMVAPTSSSSVAAASSFWPSPLTSSASALSSCGSASS